MSTLLDLGSISRESRRCHPGFNHPDGGPVLTRIEDRPGTHPSLRQSDVHSYRSRLNVPEKYQLSIPTLVGQTTCFTYTRTEEGVRNHLLRPPSCFRFTSTSVQVSPDSDKDPDIGPGDKYSDR